MAAQTKKKRNQTTYHSRSFDDRRPMADDGTTSTAKGSAVGSRSGGRITINININQKGKGRQVLAMERRRRLAAQASRLQEQQQREAEVRLSRSLFPAFSVPKNDVDVPQQQQ